MRTRARQALNRGIEQELTLHLERPRRATDAARHEIDRARKIADDLRGVSSESKARLDELRSRRRDR
jgi:hypothetical protein